MIICSLEGLQVSRRRRTIDSLRGPCFIDSFNKNFGDMHIHTLYAYVCTLYIHNFYKYTFYINKHSIYSLLYVCVCICMCVCMCIYIYIKF